MEPGQPQCLHIFFSSVSISKTWLLSRCWVNTYKMTQNLIYKLLQLSIYPTYIQHISNIYPTWKSQLFLVKYSNLHIIWLYPSNFKGSLVGKLPSYGRLSWLAFPPSCQPHHHVNHRATLLLCGFATGCDKTHWVANRRASWEAGQSSPNKWLLSEEVAQQRKVARPPVHSFIHLSIPSFIASWIHWFMDSMIIGSLAHWFIDWFIDSRASQVTHRFRYENGLMTWMICAQPPILGNFHILMFVAQALHY